MEKNGLMELLIKLGLSPPLLRFSVNPAAYYGSPNEQGDDCPSSRLKHISPTDNSSSSISQSQESMPFENRERPGKIATFGNGEIVAF
jgi:hypothetical protein